jgi:DNA-binding GntR family transcriptional regulator
MRAIPAKLDLVMQTHDALRKAIMSGELAPCAPVAQEELALQLGVSRQPISHALILLKHEGLVVDRGRKGQMVAPIDPDKLRAIYQVRGGLDRLAARLSASQLTDIKNAKQRLSEIFLAGKKAVKSADIIQLVDADVSFHKFLHELSGNAEIMTTAETTWPHMVRSMRAVLESGVEEASIWAEHKAIADAVIDKNMELAGLLAERHAEAAGEDTYQHLKQHEINYTVA